MPKRPNESLVDYRNRVIDIKSESFCAAKWLNATIWLGSGSTASCHHPPAHDIPLEELENNFTAIHNTKHKKLIRKMMIEGERPRECEYCWKIEDIDDSKVSDRVFKTIIYKDEELEDIYNKPWDHDVQLKTLEISFDRVCNLACSYCNASFSTTWAKDIKKNGAYQNLVSDGAAAFQQDGSWVEPYKNDEENPYIQAFWKWWDNGLSTSLDELRITGGEPLMSGNTWKLLDWFNSQDSEMRFAINSNLIAKEEIIDNLIEKTKNIKQFVLYTSCEAVGAHAEYIHAFKNGNYYDGICLFPKDIELSQREFNYKFFANKKETGIQASSPKPYDIIFISYNESNADENYQQLLDKYPRAKRVDRIKGIHQAHIEAAKLSDTDMFWVVDADAIIVDEFNFDHVVSTYDKETVHVWRSRNPINNLEYGYGGVKLLPKKLTLNMDVTRPDMTTSISKQFKAMPSVSNITAFNTDEFSAWKSAFRECVKLASGIIVRNKENETLERLEIWCTLGSDRPFGIYALAGANAGKIYGELNKDKPDQLNMINDFDWLKKKFEKEFSK